MAFLHKDSNIIHAYKDWENITTPADGFGFGLVSAYISPINVDINSVNVDRKHSKWQFSQFPAQLY